MSLELITIPIGFLLLSAALLWFIIGSKGKWTLKTFFIILSTSFCFLIWNSLSSITGWPTDQSTPEIFEVKWAIVNEPEKAVVGDEGSIYLWALSVKTNPSLVDKFTGNEKRIFEKQPRAYKLPYSDKARKAVEKMKEKLKKGEKVYGSTKKGGDPNKGPKGEESKKGKSSGSQSKSEDDFDLYELPPPKFSPKILSEPTPQKNKPLTMDDLRSNKQLN